MSKRAISTGIFGRVLAVNSLSLALLGVCASPADASLIAADTFKVGANSAGGEYIADPAPIVAVSNVGQSPTITGYSGAWTGNTGTNVAQWTVPAGSIGDSTGGRARFAGSSGTSGLQRRVSRSLASYTASSTYWFSVVTQIQAGDSDGAGFVGVGFTAAGTDGTFAGSVDAFRGLLIGGAPNNGGTPGSANIDDDTLDLVIRHRAQTSAAPTFGAIDTVIKSNAGDATINRVIVKLEVNAVGGNQERITAWVNPADTSSEANLGAYSAQFLDYTMSGPTDITQMTMTGINFSKAASFDIATMGTTLADVAPVPEPASMGLAAIVMMALGRRRRHRD